MVTYPFSDYHGQSYFQALLERRITNQRNILEDLMSFKSPLAQRSRKLNRAVEPV